MKVKSLLAGKPAGVITISPEQPLQRASELLTEHNIGAVVVVDEAGVPVGILSERDIVRDIARHGTGALERQVHAVMTTNIIIALPDDELAYLSNTMTAERIRHLPVMRGDELIGMVSIGDLVKAQRDHFVGEARAFEQYITGGRA